MRDVKSVVRNVTSAVRYNNYIVINVKSVIRDVKSEVSNAKAIARMLTM